MAINYELALDEQNKSDRSAIQDPGIPQPPSGYPALANITGKGNFRSAAVLGYCVVPNERTIDAYYHGELREPGDDKNPPLLDANVDRLTGKSPRPGWEFHQRTRNALYARVIGNPILLEEQAQSLDPRYKHALATAPGWIFLAEIP